MQSFLEESIFRLGFSMEDSLPRITVFGKKGVAVEGHKGILSSSDTVVVFRFGKERMRIEGERLKVCEISSDELFVRGRILCVGADNGENNR